MEPQRPAAGAGAGDGAVDGDAGDGGGGGGERRILYVGGLEEKVTEAVLRAAFMPFGEVGDVTIPLDPGTQKNKGFGFVTMEEEADAEAAVDNMAEGELYGRTLRVNFAKPMRVKLGSGKAVWDEADEWYQTRLKEDGAGAAEALDAVSSAAASASASASAAAGGAAAASGASASGATATGAAGRA